MEMNATTVRTSVNTSGPNRKMLWRLLITIATMLTISVVYIIIYPNL